MIEEGSLEIVFENDLLVAINKPHGLLAHRSALARDAKQFAVQQLRNQIGQHVFPIHRLDRKTAGVMVFCKQKQYLDNYFSLFRERQVDKTYHAIVRGFTEDEGVIDYALINEKGQTQEAITKFRTIDRFELDLPFGKYKSSRYALVEAKPETGRMHQIRKHFAHIFHPIIGDRPHGCNKQNKLWKEQWAMDKMLLHARAIQFTDPVSNECLIIKAGYQTVFQNSLDMLVGNSKKDQ